MCSTNTFKERSFLFGDRHLLHSFGSAIAIATRENAANITTSTWECFKWQILLSDVLQRCISASSSRLSVEAQPHVSRHVFLLKEPLSFFPSGRVAIVSSSIVCQPSPFLIPEKTICHNVDQPPIFPVSWQAEFVGHNCAPHYRFL